MRHIKKVMVMAALVVVITTVASACGPTQAEKDAINFHAASSPWSSETGPIPPPEGDELSILSADGAEAQYQAAEAELQAAGETCCHQEWMIDRGLTTFSIYLTQRATRWVCEGGPSALAAITGASVLVNGWISLFAVVGGPMVAKACAAKADTNCYRLRLLFGSLTPYPPGSPGYNVESWHRWCRNDWRTVV